MELAIKTTHIFKYRYLDIISDIDPGAGGSVFQAARVARAPRWPAGKLFLPTKSGRFYRSFLFNISLRKKYLDFLSFCMVFVKIPTWWVVLVVWTRGSF